MNNKKASLESQLFNAPCMVEDTEEMFWLRETDDYQSKISLGNALAAQYRFREAIAAYLSAERIRNDDPMLYLRLGGAYLTIRQFDAALAAYNRSLSLGISRKTIAYPIGIWHYLMKDYENGAKWFMECLPCDDEMAIAVIYWHTLSCLRMNTAPSLLKEYHPGMLVGHHTAYRLAVSAMSGEESLENAEMRTEQLQSDLDYVIAAYGISVALACKGLIKESRKLNEHLLSRDSVWPCVSYLAAWGDEQDRCLSNS
ncbi:MAG: hypothetical protein K2N82_08330, partial [Lachnospiraceae bacterium]|nr:hypothetical protein [Lachnospiraceae bacterium]